MTSTKAKKTKPECLVTYKGIKYVLLNVIAHESSAKGLLYVPVENVDIAELHVRNETVYPHLRTIIRLSGGSVISRDNDILNQDQLKLSAARLPNSSVVKHFSRHADTVQYCKKMFRYTIVSVQGSDVPAVPCLNDPYWKQEISKRLSSDLKSYSIQAVNAAYKLQEWLRVQEIFLRDMK